MPAGPPSTRPASRRCRDIERRVEARLNEAGIVDLGQLARTRQRTVHHPRRASGKV